MTRLDVASFDLDGTLVHPAIFNAVAEELGFGEPLRESYNAYVAGDLSLEEAFHQDYAHFVGRRVEDLHDALTRSNAWTYGIPGAFAHLAAEGWRIVVTTDQPRFLVEYLTRYGVEDLVCSDARCDDGVVTSDVSPSFDKWRNLEAWLQGEGIEPARVAHIGNGRNDIPVFERVGFAVAVNPEHPDVEAAADAVVPRVKDLRDVVDVLRDANRKP